MIKEYTRSHSGILGFEFTDKLDSSDYRDFAPLVDEAIASHGRVRLLVHFHHFEGWNPSGFWRDIKFSTQHRESIERFAVVGEENWQKALIELAKPLTNAEVKYFPADQVEAAWQWLES